MESVLSFPIEELELGVRAYNILKRMGIVTIGDFMEVSVNDLNDYTNTTGVAVGLVSAKQIGDQQTFIKENYLHRED